MKEQCKHCKGSGKIELKEMSIEDKALVLDMRKEYNDLMENPPQVKIKIPKTDLYFKVNLCWEEEEYVTVGAVYGPLQDKDSKTSTSTEFLLKIINKLSYGIDEYETRDAYWDIIRDKVENSKEWKEFSNRISSLCKLATKLNKKYDYKVFNWEKDIATDY